MAKRITVVVSQGQSQSPAKRNLEENLVAALLMEPGVDVVVVPHLYDLKPEGTGVLALQGLPGHVVVVSWLFERAARWILDRHGIHGQIGPTLLKDESEESDEDEQTLEAAKQQAAEDDAEENASEKLRVIDGRPVPNRKIYCIDLRVRDRVEPFVQEIRRIADDNRTQVVELTSWLGGAPAADQFARFMQPTNTTALGPSLTGPNLTGPNFTGPNLLAPNGPAGAPNSPSAASSAAVPGQPLRITEETDRRWYPVIDFSRCTNCMECIDFCLFGVYGVDKSDTILVEQPDNCRKGCPACSRVCPENAIMFPQHKTPAIAGAAEGASGGLKIDLSRLFGAPEANEDPFAVAARERDEQLMMAGRDAVGMAVGMPKRQAEKSTAPKDRLDDLIDALDNLDL